MVCRASPCMEADKETKGKEVVVASAGKKGKKRGGGGGGGADGKKIGADFWQELGFLVKVAMPNPFCRFSQLLLSQFTLLVEPGRFCSPRHSAGSSHSVTSFYGLNDSP